MGDVIQYLLVFAVVAVCALVTVRMLYRVLSGKSGSCSMCEHCEPTGDAKRKSPCGDRKEPPKQP